MKQAFATAALFTLAASFASGSHTLSAQDATLEFPKASPSSLFRTNVGMTTVEIEYARPGVRGRKIFGGLIPYGEIWRTGANEATKVTFSTDVTFGGAAVPAGSYALFTIPGEAEWTVILNKAVGQWGSYSYDKSNDLVRVKVKPITMARPVETMTIALSRVRGDAATFTIAWEKTLVPIRIKTNLVEMMVPKIEAAMAAEGGEKPYFAAAMFYYHHDIDLSKAVEWIDAAEREQPDAMWIVYRKGLILAKAGDKKAAIEAATQSAGMAKDAGGELGAEYMRLSRALIAKLK